MPDTLDTVQAELARAMIPHPDDYLQELSPQAALFLLRQLAMAVLQVVTGAAASLGEDGDGDGGAVTEALNGTAMAVAGSTHALVALEVLPAEAELSLEGGAS